jgi:hypothetical protein
LAKLRRAATSAKALISANPIWRIGRRLRMAYSHNSSLTNTVAEPTVRSDLVDNVHEWREGHPAIQGPEL